MRRQFVTGLLAVLAMGAGAQDASREGKALDTVQVTAVRRVEGTTVQGLSRGAMERRGVASLADAVSRLSGVNLRDYGCAGGLKTLSVHSLGAGHTAVALDGFVVGDSESGQTDLSRFALEQLDSMALVVGDASGMLVPAALMARAATLHLVKRVPVRNTLSVGLAGGSFGLAQVCADGALLMRGRWAVRAQADFLRADNCYPFTLVNGSTVTRERRNNSGINRGRGEVNIYHGTDFAAKLYYYEAAKQLPGQVVYYNPVNHERDRYRNALAQASWRHGMGGGWSLAAHARGSFSRERYYDHNPLWTHADSTRVYDQTDLYAGVVAVCNVLKGLDVSAGADYCFQQLDSPTLDVVRPRRHSFFEALRLRWQDRRITATASLLVSHYYNNVERGTAAADCHRLSPSASVAYTPCRQLTARIYYKDVFRPATFNDNYYTRSGTRDLRPEKARNLGWGVDLNLRHITMGLESYRAWVDDKIVAMPMNAFFWSVVNVGKVRIWGLEARLSGQWRTWSWLAVEPAASYTLQRAVNVTDSGYRYYGHQIAYTPRHSASGSVSLLTQWASVAVSCNGVGERWSTNANLPAAHIDGYQVWNISVWRDFKVLGCKLSLRGDVLNVADRQYEIIRLYPMPGRSFKVTGTFNL